MLKKCLLILCCCLACAAASAEEYTPGRHTCGQPDCFWETPMDVTDHDAVWRMLTAPITVISGGQKEQILLRAEPDENSDAVGEITCDSQGVHVLSHLDNGWSLVECYSSSFAGSRVGAWNRLVTGYVPTRRLQVKQVRTKYGLVADKLDQRLYIFRDGTLVEILKISTGLPTEDAPWNETRSGEFLLCSRLGEFPSEPLYCRYGIRFNAGDVLHEVPHRKNGDGTRNYRACEPKLGERASHGCIRVQRLQTPDGVNMQWLWNELADQLGTRIVIWEDFDGRTLPPVPLDTPVYYNPDGGTNYHESPVCRGVRDRYLPLTAITWEQLLDEHDDLTPCSWCVPPVR